MKRNVTIGLIGNYHSTVRAHQAIPLALARVGQTLHVEVRHEWVPTCELSSVSRVAGMDGLWCVPASPYRSIEGALLAIQHARESLTPFLGTCGGFQHALVEYARNVLGWADAEHAETAPSATRAVISPLECALIESTKPVRLFPGSRLAAAYNATETMEGFHCRYGLNPEFRAAILGGPLRVCAEDDTGEVRAIELDHHPFFVATLFQPERAALDQRPVPLVEAFVRAAANPND